MWPMLLELLPHITRLVPMADKYFSGRSASEKAQEAALAALAVDVRGNLGQVSDAHSNLAGQVKEIQGQNALIAAQVSQIGEDATRARIAVESVEARIGKLERTAQTAMKLLAVVLMLLSITLILLAILLLRPHNR